MSTGATDHFSVGVNLIIGQFMFRLGYNWTCISSIAFSIKYNKY